jgi:O-antigen ligase
MVEGRGSREVSYPETDRWYAPLVVLFILLHIPLAFVFRSGPELPTVHAIVTLAIGLFWVVKDRKPWRLIYLVAYIAGAELLWRGSHASVFWEYGKYATGVLLVLGMLKQRRFFKSDKRPLVYFVLLFPSISVLEVFDRQGIAFNLSGPFALAMSAMFFSTVSLSPKHIKRILVAALAPIIGLGVLASYLTLNAESITFTGVSIRATAAGIGPNQVSSILGLGSLIAFLYLCIDRGNIGLRFLMIGLATGLLAQASLTFSRGGVWAALLAGIVAVFYLLRYRDSRPAILASATVVLLLLYFMIFPVLNDFTRGTLRGRYKDFDPTGRQQIMQADFQAFKENPLLGVGPGGSKAYHAVLFRPSNAHTEYTRLVAEHGIMGLFSLMILIWMSLKRFLNTADPQGKALVCSFTTWALLFMWHSAMRLVAPCLLFGIASANVLPDKQDIRQETGADQILPRGQAGLRTSATAGSFGKPQRKRDVGRRAVDRIR